MLASDRCHVLDRSWHWPADSLVIDFADPDGAAAAIAAAQSEGAPIQAVLPVGGELPAQVAAAAARRLGLAANAPSAMTAAGNKLALRTRLAAPLPRFICVETRRRSARGSPTGSPPRAASASRAWSSR